MTAYFTLFVFVRRVAERRGLPITKNTPPHQNDLCPITWWPEILLMIVLTFSLPPFLFMHILRVNITTNLVKMQDTLTTPCIYRLTPRLTLKYPVMLNKKVLMSGADFFSNDAQINPYYDNEAIDVEQAKTEHRLIHQAFEQAGIEVVKVDPPTTSQDGVYTANWALVYDGKAVMSRLPTARQTEEPHARQVLQGLGFETIFVPADWHFSGQGDSLPCGRFLLAGSGYRSDPRAQAFAADTLGLELVQLHAIPKLNRRGQPVINAVSGWPDSFFYDIDLAISVLREDLIAYCPDAFDAPSRARIAALPLDRIQVDYDEAVSGLACNLVSTGETVIMSAQAPKLRAKIENRGLKTIAPDVTELAKGGGYIRCVSLTIHKSE